MLRFFLSLLIFASGLINVISVLGPVPLEQVSVLQQFFPIQFLDFSKFATLFIGFALIISSINIFKYKKRAFDICFFLCAASLLLQMLEGFNLINIATYVFVMSILFYARDRFKVKSQDLKLKSYLPKFLLFVFLSLAYGTSGFWLLKKTDMGFDFNVQESIYYTVLQFFFIEQEKLIPQNHYAEWFLNSISLLSLAFVVYVLWASFKPAKFDQEHSLKAKLIAKKIIFSHGTDSLDFFKIWDDKQFYFSKSKESFIAYRTSESSIITLSDPVGPKEEIAELIKNFDNFCSEHDWNLVFFQTKPSYLDLYKAFGFNKLKIGDEAIVDLENFDLKGPKKKDFRNRIRKIEKLGFKFKLYEEELSEELLNKLEQVSNEWLEEPGRVERGFSLGYYDKEYIKKTLVCTVEKDHEIVAFLNIIPSFEESMVCVDMMRKSKNAPSGIMDYIFVKAILTMKDLMLKKFSLGLAPMSGFEKHENAGIDEVTIHSVFKRLNFIFNYSGLKTFKEKFADTWEPRYLIYKSLNQLPRLALSINDILKVK